MMGGMARTTSAFNRTGSPVVIDPDGTSIPGGEHDKVDPSIDEVQAAVDAGSLILAADARSPEEQAALDEAAAAAAAQAEADAAALLEQGTAEPAPAKPAAPKRRS